MESRNFRPLRGRLTRTPAILIIIFSVILVALAWFAVDSRASDNKDRKEAVTYDEGLGKAADEIERMQRSLKPVKEENIEAAFEIPEPLITMPVIEEPPSDNDKAFEIYQRLDDKSDPLEEYRKRLSRNRETAFFRALESGSRVSLTLVEANSYDKRSETLDPDNRASGDFRSYQQSQLRSAVANLNNLSDTSSGFGSGSGGSFVSSSKTLSAYNSLDQGSDFAHPYTVEAADTPFMIRMGAVIPAVLVSGINSDLPGLVIAQVIENVYDSAMGNHLLIPKGSRLIGQYGSSPKIGQERVMLGFNRVIYPDGSALTLGSMPGAAMDGYSGFDADVDNHMFRLLTNAVILGGITASVTLATDSNRYDSDGVSASQALSQGLGVSLGNVLTRVIEQNMNISPTLKVEPGYLFNVVVAKDIRFKGPYQDPFS